MAAIPERIVAGKNGEQVVVRTAHPDDAAALIALTTSVLAERRFSISELDEFDRTEEQERAWIDAHTEAYNNIAIVAEIAGSVVGLLNCECGDRRRLAHRATLSMSVNKEHRGVGVGSALMQALIDWTEDHPTIVKVSLGVLSTNTPAIRLYEKFGFVKEGHRPREVRFGPEEYVDDFLMYRFVDGRG